MTRFNKIRLSAYLIPAVFIVLFCLPAGAQVELVPAEHGVYGFLKRMQVRGILTEQYSDYTLPHDRRTVASLLADIARGADNITKAERDLLRGYSAEFSYELGLPRDERVSLIGEGIGNIFDSREKYLYRYEDSTAVISAGFYMSGEVQNIDEKGISGNNASLWRLGGGISGTLSDWFGFSLHAVNGYVGGSREVGLRNIEVARTYKIDEPDSRFFDITRGHLRASNAWGSVTVGRERLIVGNGTRRNALLFSDYAPKTDYIGIELRYKRFFFNFFHGWILGNETLINHGNAGNFRSIPDKYVSFHRFGMFFFGGRMQAGFSEVIVYGGRGAEIAYLNPFLFFKSVEHSLRDRDKAMIAFDIQARPLRGLEVYGDLLIDDLAFEKLGTDWFGNQFAYRIGMTAVPPAAFLSDALLTVDYQRIRPYVYTHRIAMNAYTHGGYPLGSPAGPNSDMWDLRWNHIWPGRIETEVYLRFLRKGRNITDDEGVLIRNVGGDTAQGYRQGDSDRARFLDGDLEKSRYAGISLKTEILRQFYISAGYEYRNLEKVPHSQTFHGHFMFGKLVIVM